MVGCTSTIKASVLGRVEKMMRVLTEDRECPVISI